VRFNSITIREAGEPPSLSLSLSLLRANAKLLVSHTSGGENFPEQIVACQLRVAGDVSGATAIYLRACFLEVGLSMSDRSRCASLIKK